MIALDPVDLARYDLILVNTSGGKDSALSAWYVRQLAEPLGVLDRVLLVHATFPEEWPGTVDLVRRQAGALGLPIEVVSRGEGLLDYVRRRRKWPGLTRQARYCTSDFKRAPIDRVITARTPRHRWRRRPWRVLSVMGIRADESRERASKRPFQERIRDGQITNGVRVVDEWYPLFRLATGEVWSLIRQLGLEMHPAYAEGMPRLSCRFCIFAPRDALIRAGHLHRDLLEAYAAVEREIGHSFKTDLKIAGILDAVERGEKPRAVTPWEM
jgi:3'-phosphoadenosine 5'-phosphosulfate sulfotransferase (PAPS reductase)/FAD synthetase